MELEVVLPRIEQPGHIVWRSLSEGVEAQVEAALEAAGS
jgi:hypothetical protein